MGSVDVAEAQLAVAEEVDAGAIIGELPLREGPLGGGVGGREDGLAVALVPAQEGDPALPAAPRPESGGLGGHLGRLPLGEAADDPVAVGLAGG
ncbi:MAG: hypothetical protein ACOX6M_03535 [Armatimonadota bacterium]